MKKFLFIILFSCAVGCLISFYVLKNNDSDDYVINKRKDIVAMFQIGYYENYDNAIKMKNSFDGAIILNNDNSYRVIVSVLKNLDAINKMKEYLEEKNIKYYIKYEELNLIDSFDEYEKLFIETDNTESYIYINKTIMNKLF